METKNRKWLKWDPKFNAGHLIALISVALAYYSFQYQLNKEINSREVLGISLKSTESAFATTRGFLISLAHTNIITAGILNNEVDSLERDSFLIDIKKLNGLAIDYMVVMNEFDSNKQVLPLDQSIQIMSKKIDNSISK